MILQYLQFVLGYSPLVAGVALAPLAVEVMASSPRVPVVALFRAPRGEPLAPTERSSVFTQAEAEAATGPPR